MRQYTTLRRLEDRQLAVLERLDAAESAATSTEEAEDASAGSGTGLRQERVLRRLARAEVKGRRCAQVEFGFHPVVVESVSDFKTLNL